MKIETILNACQSTYIYRKARHTEPSIFFLRRHRQYHTFRDRIIRVDEIGRAINADLCTEIEMLDAEIKHLKETCCHD